MDYLLDTNICIHFFKGQFGLIEKLKEIGFEKCAISEITLAELFFGAEKSQNKDKNLAVLEEFADKITILPIFNSLKIYALIKAKLKTKGTIISDLDLFIGATAVSYNMVLVTRNIKEFERIDHLKIENWID